MENSECVRVAVNIRPLITSELLMGCTDCITVVPGEPQVQIGAHSFTYDYVYGSTGSPSSAIYNDCVAPLVDALFHGYNATVLAYGQTGSGKTYTMGTNYTGEGSSGGIIPKVMETIFKKVDEKKHSIEFLIRVSFIEIFKEEVFDLLDLNPVGNKGDGPGGSLKAAAPARAPIQIRETVSGGITLAGVTEPEVRSKEEMASFLVRGSLSRATGSTNMNSQSSRSHAIFTITMEQKKFAHSRSGECDEIGDDILCAKLHLVDLAGSERAKRTGADGLRLKEGIHINRGLLALGNVISALGDEKKRKEGGHVPYRDSKLTRLLQDSLGGNSKTVMIACVSPAETNAEETLNTLKYANRARNIQNKAIVNRDPMATQLQSMRSQIEQLQAELLFYRGDTCVPFDEIQILKHKVSLLEASNAELQRELKDRQITCEHLSQSAFDAQIERDKLMMQIESARNGKSWTEIDSDSQDVDLLKTYVSKIQHLEGELLRLKRLSNLKRSHPEDCIDSDDEGFHSRNVLFPPLNENLDANAVDISKEIEDEEEQEHSSRQEKLDRELKELDRKLEQKEAEMKRFSSTDTSVLKLHYEKKVQELEQEKRALQQEIDELRNNLSNISSASGDSAQKLKEDYLQKLTALEAQVTELKKKQDAQAQLLRQKQKSDEAAKRLHDEIQRIKSHKVQLQQKIKQESEQFRLWKASREKEVLQLKKEGRRNEYEMHKLLALNQRQKMVLQRKTEEAAMATKRLKELLESRRASSGGANGSGPGIQALMNTIEHELEVTVRVHEVRSAYERQLQERARMADELARLKEEAVMMKQTNLSDSPSSMSPGARNSRIFALENMLSSSSSTLVSMGSQLSEAEERERGFSGRGRWHQVRSLAEAKNTMNHLFNLASSSRCLLWDKEVDCKEKDGAIRDLKEKVLKLSSLVRHLEMQKAELIRQLKSQSSALKKYSERSREDSELPHPHMESEVPDTKLQKNASRKQVRSSMMLLEDMDTSESEQSDTDTDAGDDGDDGDWVPSARRPTRKGTKGRQSVVTINGSGNSKSDSSGEGGIEGSGNTALEGCCSCSKYALCKTSKCQCRASGGKCGPLCSCLANKCSNREAIAVDQLAESEDVDVGSNSDDEKNHALASHGALLLRSALAAQADSNEDDNGMKRKPLSDIGNTAAKSNAAKPNQRKKWRKSVIQLVRVAPPSTQPANTEPEAPPKSDNDNVSNANGNNEEVPLKLPRAMQTAASNSNALLRERNADQASEQVNKDGGAALPPPSRRPSRPPRPAADEKENYGRYQ